MSTSRGITPLAGCLLAALAVRVICSFSYASWNHPDEWYQTVEFARVALGQPATFSHEMALHVRNGLLPLLLTLPLRAAALAGGGVAARVHAVHLFAGLTDLLIFWGMAAIFVARGRSRRELWAALGLWALVPVFFHDSVRPSVEHFGAIALVVALGCLARGRAFAAGVATVAAAALKYPAGTASLGLSLAYLAGGSADRRAKLRFATGLALGFAAFGVCDVLLYPGGRPWESLYTYVQYNLLTSLGKDVFGAQPMSTFWDYFSGRWFRGLAPLGLGIALFGARGLWTGLRRLEPAAWAFAFYLGSHLLVAHKEPRFMAPLEPLAWILACEGFWSWKDAGGRFPVPRKALAAAAAIWIAGILLWDLRALWGETWRLPTQYLEVSEVLRENPSACAVVSEERFSGSLLPDVRPAFGYFAAERHASSHDQAASAPLAWAESAPAACREDSLVLLLVERAGWEGWQKEGCRILPYGILGAFPESAWPKLLGREGWVSALWLACPGRVLSRFSHPMAERSLVTAFPALERLPGWGISGEELKKLEWDHLPAEIRGKCHYLCI